MTVVDIIMGGALPPRPAAAGRGEGDIFQPIGPIERYRVDPDEADADAWGTLGVPELSLGTGSLLHVLERPLATLRHAFYAPGTRVPLHIHGPASIVYGIGGPCLERAGSKRVSKRRLNYHPPGYAHELLYQGYTAVLAIEIDEEALGSAAEPLPAQSCGLPATLFPSLWNIVFRIIREERLDTVDTAIADFVRQALAFARKRLPPWLKALLDTLHSEWKSPPSAAAHARRLGLSTGYLCRAFKHHMGVTLQQYSLHIRTERARALLWGTEMPITQVAAETGFADQSHLTRALAARYQLTPLRLRSAAPGRRKATRRRSNPARN